MGFPRIIISALRGGAGKTILSLGIIAALKGLGHQVAPFKKGPDYIDAGWLALAAGRPCYNLDTFLIAKEQVLNSFLTHTRNDDIAVVEGNRGLYDGIDPEGSTSTAELAKLLKTPVILGLDCTKSTRTMAAAVLGCQHFDPEVNIAGVILNQVAGDRHAGILRSSIEDHCGLPVLGAVPKLKEQHFPERHMGLVPTPEHDWAKDSIESAAKMASDHMDLDAIVRIAQHAARKPIVKISQACYGDDSCSGLESIEISGPPIIGIMRDSAFQFYYPENLEALETEGARLKFLSPLKEDQVPDIDGLYIGGGFPETHVRQLAQNKRFRHELKALAEAGLPIYAECGGLMYLGEALVMGETSYPMAGVLPVVFGFSKKPQGHGYTVLRVEGENPYFEIGTQLKGHEFHYSRVIECHGDGRDPVFSMIRGTGLLAEKDGVCYKNVLATYSHLHALGTPLWAKAMVRNAICYKKKIESGNQIS
jgi:cobyrinic acid a,c-diamide synthase